MVPYIFPTFLKIPMHKRNARRENFSRRAFCFYFVRNFIKLNKLICYLDNISRYSETTFKYLFKTCSIIQKNAVTISGSIFYCLTWNIIIFFIFFF